MVVCALAELGPRAGLASMCMSGAPFGGRLLRRSTSGQGRRRPSGTSAEFVEVPISRRSRVQAGATRASGDDEDVAWRLPDPPGGDRAEERPRDEVLAAPTDDEE